MRTTAAAPVVPPSREQTLQPTDPEDATPPGDRTGSRPEPPTGVLIINAGPAYRGREIAVSPVGDPERRTRATVRARYLPAGVLYTALYVGLPEGRYAIWAPDGSPRGHVTVLAGTVTDHDWATGR
jgi:hypothetical protein